MHTAVAAEALALERLYHWERTAADRVVLTQPTGGGAVRDYTWRDVLDQTRRMAAHLLATGLQHGDRVAILGKNSAHWLIADFAIWMAGGVSVPLYPTLAAGTVRQILEHSAATLLFVGKLDGWEEMRPGVPADLPIVRLPLSTVAEGAAWDDIVTRTQPLAGNPVRDGDELATIMYTSGTTGTPKGVMHSFATFAWSTAAVRKRLPTDERSRVLSYLPLSHVAERTVVEHMLLASSMHVYFAESLETFAADMRRARPTVFFSVPRLWVKFQQGVLAKMPARKLDRLLGVPVLGRVVGRKVLAGLGLDQCEVAAGGAAPMPPDLLRWFARLGLEVTEVYGMTENCGVSHATVRGKLRPGTVGYPYDGVLSRLDPDTSEIQVKSPGTMLGYYKDPGQTAQTLTPDGWLRTGDKGVLDAEGGLRISGRVKDIFKTGKGKYVAPAPIEDKLVTHGAVEACCVAGANLGQPLAILMLNMEAAQRAADAAQRAALEASLASHLESVNALLDPHERLDCLVVVTQPWTVESGFITPTFKVRRNRIEDVYAPFYERWVVERRTVIWHDA
jgi:long-chain acyl-CoA synthetase